MAKYQQLYPGYFFHVYKSGNSGENLFRIERNYVYFLSIYEKYISPIADTYCYCLLPNHIHFLIKIKEESPTSDDGGAPASSAFSNLFSTYTKSFNKFYKRSGSLFEKPFKRSLIEKNNYLFHLAVYIHRNPQRHGLVEDFQDWKYSSYRVIKSESPTRIQKNEVLDWYGGRDGFVDSHSIEDEKAQIRDVVFENRS
jgi:REP element-mobilizing transposase RayT